MRKMKRLGTAFHLDSPMPNHPNKHIREAIKYAEEQGWRVVKSGGQAHIWGKLYCPANQRGGCIIKVYSTPRVPEHHARHIREQVDDCPHAMPNGADGP